MLFSKCRFSFWGTRVAHPSSLPPVRHGMETGGECVRTRVTLLSLTHRRVEHLHAVAVVKELAARLLASARVLQGLGASGPVRAPVHQQLGRDHDDNGENDQIWKCSQKKETQAHQTAKELRPGCDRAVVQWKLRTNPFSSGYYSISSFRNRPGTAWLKACSTSPADPLHQ